MDFSDWGISCEIALIWMSLDLYDEKSTSVQVMLTQIFVAIWCHSLNIKMPSYQYIKSYYGNKKILRLFYIHKGVSYTGKITFWIKHFNLLMTIVLSPQWDFDFLYIEKMYIFIENAPSLWHLSFYIITAICNLPWIISSIWRFQLIKIMPGCIDSNINPSNVSTISKLFLIWIHHWFSPAIVSANRIWLLYR